MLGVLKPVAGRSQDTSKDTLSVVADRTALKLKRQSGSAARFSPLAAPPGDVLVPRVLGFVGPL